MRKSILIMLVILLASCAGAYQQASHISDQAYLGMPMNEFRGMAGKKAKLEAMESGYTVYRMYDYDAWSGARTDTKFFYFGSDGKLYKIDGGEFKQKRYQIEVINN